jgi:hypothetical protein
MRNRRTAVLSGVLAAGVMLTQQACASIDDETAAPATSASPSAEPISAAPSSAEPTAVAPPSAAPTSTSSTGDNSDDSGSGSPEDILAGKRQIVIRPVQTSESILAVDTKGRLNVTDGDSGHSLFVLAKEGNKYLIKTAKAGAGGEPSCMGIKSNGSNSLTVVAAACDAGRAGQLFTIRKQEKKVNGRPAYAIDNQGAFLQIPSDAGLIAEELGDSPLRTTYTFVDNGKSSLPILD